VRADPDWVLNITLADTMPNHHPSPNAVQIGTTLCQTTILYQMPFRLELRDDVNENEES
jgi:hypothetical protein